MILLQMARMEWAKRGGVTPDWDAFNNDEKERWVQGKPWGPCSTCTRQCDELVGGHAGPTSGTLT